MANVSTFGSLDDVNPLSKPPACLTVDKRHLDEKIKKHIRYSENDSHKTQSLDSKLIHHKEKSCLISK